MLLHDCIPNLSQILRIEKLLKNVSQLAIDDDVTSPLYSKTTKRENVFVKETIKNVKITKMI